jgi:glucosylceramidase
MLPLRSEWDADIQLAVDSGQRYQTMDGFGAALTGSAAYVIYNYLDETARSQLLRTLFDPDEGIGLSYLRLTVGASDFSRFDYTYNDLPTGTTDPDLSEFDLRIEEEYLIPVLQEILAIRPDLKIMATPWSPPAWMKTNNDLAGGELRTDFQDAFANYFVKYIQAMAAHQIPIHALTVQNEPLYAAPYPSMKMSATRQQDFIKNHLAPTLSAAGLDPEIIIYDHNWDNTTYPLSILNDPATKALIAGTAFHCYAGDVSAMSSVHAAHPDKGLYFTECSGGDFSPNFATNLAWNTENLLVGATRNWAKTILLWNLALDEQHGPRNGGCQDCRGVVTVNSSNGVVQRNVEYYLLGHLAKFVQAGAERIETPNTRAEGLSQVAFRNPDSSRVLLLFNHEPQKQKVAVRVEEEKAFVLEIDAGMLVSCRW